MSPPGDIPKVPGIGFPRPPPAPPAPEHSTGSPAQGARAPVPAADLADIRPLDVAGGLQILIAEVRAALEAALLAAVSATPAHPEEPVLTLPGPLPAAPPAAGEPVPGAPPGTPPPVPGAPGPLPPTVTTTGTLLAALTAGGLPGVPGPPPASAPDAARQVVELLLGTLPPEQEPAAAAAAAPALPPLDSVVQSASAQALAVIDGWRGAAPATREAVVAAGALIANALGDEPLNAAWLRPDWAGLLPRLEQYRRRRRRRPRRFEDPDDPRRGRPEDERR